MLRSWQLAALVVVVLGSVARLAYLDADPYYYQWIGYVIDEGRWMEQARSIYLFNTVYLGRISSLHLLISPGFQLAGLVSFSIFDVHLWSARLVSALFGIGIIVATYWTFRERIEARPLFFAVLVLAFQMDLVFLSRVAIPEMASLFGHLVAFAILMTGRLRVIRAVLASMACTIALAMKATTLFLAPAYLIAIVMVRDEPPALKLKAAAAFTSVLAFSLILGAALGPVTGVIDTTRLLGSLEKLREFVSISDPYSQVSLYFVNSYMASINLLLLGGWLVSWILVAGTIDWKDPASRILQYAGVWSVWWLAISMFLSYAPARYVLHALLPLVLYVSAGAHLGRAGRLSDAFERVAGAPRGLMRVIYVTWLALPLAILTAPVLAAFLASIANVPVESVAGRLRQQLALIAVTTLVVVLVDILRPLSKATMQNLAYGSLLAALIWALGSVGGALWTGFWDVAPSPALWKRLTALLIPFLALGVLHGRSQAAIAVTTQAIIVALVAALFLEGLLPQYSRPTFSIRDEGRALASVFAANAEVHSLGANTLFLENKLRYREDGFDSSRPPAGVVVFGHLGPECCKPTIKHFGQSYRIKYQRALQFDPRYFAIENLDRSQALDTVAVYEPEKP